MDFDPGSYRDPQGRIFYHEGRVLRMVTPAASPKVKRILDDEVIQTLINNKKIIASKIISPASLNLSLPKDSIIIEHDRVDTISYPYEWSFKQLKAAAAFHLELHIDLLKHGYTLSDASAYNVQFCSPGCKPIFIDLLSIEPYVEGSYWLGQEQFCTHFLAPLVITAKTGISFNNWYKGSIEGVSVTDANKMLPASKWLSSTLLSNIVLPSYFQNRFKNTKFGAQKEFSEKVKKPLPKNALLFMLNNLRGYIQKLSTKNVQSIWQNYSNDNSYAKVSASAKSVALKKFFQQNHISKIWDIGCNSGEYSQLALESGVKLAVGFDFDGGALDAAFDRARKNKLNFLPLYLDATNPSTDSGWRQSERKGLLSRTDADAVIALAFIHHLAIARNIPLIEIIDWLLRLAPEGIIEFVEKDDPTVLEMLALREDIFPDYQYNTFISLLKSRASLVEEIALPESTRTLVHYRTS